MTIGTDPDAFAAGASAALGAGEPAPVAEGRRAARERLAAGSELPRWPVCDLRGFDPEEYRPASAVPSETVRSRLKPYRQAWDRSGGMSALILHGNGRCLDIRVREDLAERGLIVADLDTALREMPERIQPHLFSTDPGEGFGRLQDLHTAFRRGGTFLFVPKDLEIPGPIQIVTVFDEEGAAFFDHTLVVLEPRSSASVVEHVFPAAESPAPALHVPNTEILAGEGSRIQYAVAADWGEKSWSFAARRARLGRDAVLRWVPATLGGGFVKSLVRSDLPEPGARADLHEVFIGRGTERLHLESETRHLGAHTEAEMLTKGVLAGKSSVFCRGVVVVPHGAKATASSLHQRILMLSDGCRADTVPCMFVDENDVRASHSASVGQLDEEMIFYLMTRGLERAQAESMIVSGFFEEMIERLPHEELREEIRAGIRRKLDLPS